MVAWRRLLLLVANTINIAADLAAMGAALQLVIGGAAPRSTRSLFGAALRRAGGFVPYRRYAPILKGLTLVLFVYVGTVMTVHIDWAEALRARHRAAAVARTRLRPDQVVAVFGTTISPYVFFWQAARRSRTCTSPRHRRRCATCSAERAPTLDAHRRWTPPSAWGSPSPIAVCIMLTTAATLHVKGITDIATSAEAAEALRPLAGEFTFFLFALGIIGTGLLAVPVLAGSAAYAVAEAMRLALRPRREPREAEASTRSSPGRR